ncbi:MAG: FGGY-family carbohydrate kinase [Williamsia sp.]|nr:FGGY-family carbohydrate kinase [Williamsia sp.]
MHNYFIGIDIGTQGARVVLLDELGQQVGAHEEGFPLSKDSREEQSPQAWWECCKQLLGSLIREAKDKISLSRIMAMAVTSTSGTIIPLDHDCNPLYPAIMYSDPRSAEEALFCKAIAMEQVGEGYKGFNSSSGLPKMRWFLHQYPRLVDRLYKFIHAADFMTGRLCGEYGTTDYANALKSGYNLHTYEWPSYIARDIGIEKDWLQQVKPSGVPLGTLLPGLAREWGLPQGILVTTGITDGCASQVASGAVSPGQWNTTLGTTMVIKGVTRQEIVDPTGAIYNHRHPAGYWMPGGASNTGADWVSQFFAGRDLQELNRLAAAQLPSMQLAWPLLQAGERFPFFAPHARGFWPGGDKVEKFVACMEGVAFIERYAYEKISQLSGEQIELIFSAGGGSNSSTWLQIRSSVLNRPVYKMKTVSGAAGAAILAASQTFYSSLQEAAKAMALPEAVVEPQAALIEPYRSKYEQFMETLHAKHILQ